MDRYRRSNRTNRKQPPKTQYVIMTGWVVDGSLDNVDILTVDADWRFIRGKNKEGTKLQTAIPKDLLPSFVRGESSRGWTDFSTCEVSPLTSRAELEGRGRNVTGSTILFTTTWQCVFGGHRRLCKTLAPGEIPPAPAPGSRRSKKEHGESIKEPQCQCR